MTARAIVSADGQSIIVSRGAWSMTIATTELPGWIAFYERGAARKHPRFGTTPFAANYEPVLKALRRAQRIVDTMRGTP